MLIGCCPFRSLTGCCRSPPPSSPNSICPLALLGLALLALFLLIAIVGPFLLPFDFNTIPPPDKVVYQGRGPSVAHPFGETGGLQRDVLTLVINGARMSLLIGFSSMVIGVVIGTVVGSIAGFFGGLVDNVLMRIVDVMLSMPLLFVILVANIATEAWVSFLGFGVDLTVPTWGNILSNSLTFIPLGNWWWPFFSGMAIIVTVLSVNFIGDGLRDALDPRTRA